MSSSTTVLIAGAGLGGLMMANLLGRAGINYLVFEKADRVRALGSAINLACNVQPLFAQLGLEEGLIKISKPSNSVNVYNEKLKSIGHINYEEYISISGYASRTMARPDLVALLLGNIPSSKILLNKKVQHIEQDSYKVTLHCADGSFYQGDVLVGSDGAYSKVRQSIFQELDKQQILPKSDAESMRACHMSILGITQPLDPERYPVLKEPATRYDSVIGIDKPNTWRYFTIPDNRIAWRIDHQIAASPMTTSRSRSHIKSTSPISSKSSSMVSNEKVPKASMALLEWGTESSDAIPDEWRKFPCPIGGTMGDLFDQTPRETVSKVVLEEKLYQTWYHGRIVLIGDACHKMLPNSGRGAVNAMLDAIILTNALYEKAALDPNLENTEEAFREYYDERYPHAIAEIERSKRMARVVAGQTWADTLVRKVFFKILPKRSQDNSYAAMLSYRPQLAFLPQVPERGSIPALPQKITFGGSSSMGPEEEDRMVKATLLIFGIYSVIVNSIGLYATIRKSVAAAKASFIIWIIQVSWICLSIVLLFIALFSLSERDRDQLPKPSAKAYVQVFVDLLRTSIHGWALFVFLRDLKGRQRNALGFLVKEGGVFEYEPLEPGRVHL
ncbi:hypothetical protein FBU30_006604 [Linnemannia zychae]|nr:hypothetical protein FBU30_006604 [Linnemannia zychae]